MRRLLGELLVAACVALSSPAADAAAVSISLVPSSLSLLPGDNLLLDIRASRAGSAVDDKAVAAFSFDLVFDTDLFYFTNAFVGDRLGDITSGEAFAPAATVDVFSFGRSVVHLFEVSVLDLSALDALQRDPADNTFSPAEFSLGSVLLKARMPPGDPYFSRINVTNLVLSDPDGIALETSPPSLVTEVRLHQVPEPPTISLLVIAGLLLCIGQLRRVVGAGRRAGNSLFGGARASPQGRSAITVVGVVPLAVSLCVATPLARADITILPLGDSLTLGLECPAGSCTIPGPGYRGHLLDFLSFETISYRGSLKQAITPRFAALAASAARTDAEVAGLLFHEGHKGKTLNELANLRCPTTGTDPCFVSAPGAAASGLQPWVKYAPTAILLLGGTNDLDSTSYWGDFTTAKDCPSAYGGSFGTMMAGDCLFARLKSLIEDRLLKVAVDVFVATVPPKKGSSATVLARNHQVDIYNAYIASLPGTLSFGNLNVRPVVVNWEKSTDVGPDLTHLTDAGYKKLAERWYTVLMSTLAAGRAPGDFNRDGKVDITDLQILTAGLNKKVTHGVDPRFDDPRDLDGDGSITVLDARLLVSQYCTHPKCAP